MIKRLAISLSVVAALSTGSVYAQSPETNATAPAKTQAPKAITFTFTDTSGQKITLSETPDGIRYDTLPGKNVITMFYIYSGTPCRNELKMFSESIVPKHPDLAIVTYELKGLTPQKLKAFEAELGIKGIHMIDTRQAMPFADYIARRIRWQGSVPLLIVSDKNGTVKHMQLGAMTLEQTEAILKKL
jgi:peroxiredoxin